MRSIWLMALANISKKKGESILIALSIFVAVAALEVGLGLFAGLHKPFEAMVAQTESPHLLVFFDTGLHDTNTMRAWFEDQPEVASVSAPLAIYNTRSGTVSNDQKLDTSLSLTEVPANPEENRPFMVVAWPEGTPEPKKPGMGDIWIPKQLAHSKSLALGDTIGIPTSSGMRELRIGAFLLDPYFSTSNISPTRCWIASGSLPSLVPMGDMNECYLGVRLHDAAQSSAVDKRFKAHLGGNFAGWVMTYAMAKLAYSLFLNMVTVALLIVALMALIIALSMMSATITSAVYAQFKQIGVLKVAGFTPRGINTIFIVQYLSLGLLTIPAGIAVGFWIGRAIFANITQSIGLLTVSFSWLMPVVIPLILVTSVLALGAWWTSRKAGRIQPMQAIRFGAPETRVGNPSPLSSRLLAIFPPKLFLAWRNLSLNPRRTIFAGLGMAMTVLVLVFSVNIVDTFSSFSENKALWGDSSADITVGLTSKRFTIKDYQFLRLMNEESGISAILPSRSVKGTTPDSGDALGKTIFGDAFDGDMDALGFINLEGRNPREAHEIALGVNTAKQAGKNLGDTFHLFLEGQSFPFEVCGIFQTANNLGEGFRIQATRLKEVLPKYRAGSFAVKLEKNTDPDQFKSELKQRFSEAVSVTTSAEEQEETSSILGGMRVTLLLLCLILLAVSAVMLINDTLLSLVEHKKMFGILKTLGMTPSDLRLALSLKAGAISLISLVFALPLGLILIPKALSVLAAGIGLVQFPMSVNLGGTLLIIPLVIGFACISTWFAAKPVTRIEPRQLICE